MMLGVLRDLAWAVDLSLEKVHQRPERKAIEDRQCSRERRQWEVDELW